MLFIVVGIVQDELVDRGESLVNLFNDFMGHFVQLLDLVRVEEFVHIFRSVRPKGVKLMNGVSHFSIKVNDSSTVLLKDVEIDSLYFICNF